MFYGHRSTPDRPTIGSTTAGSGTIELTWTAPSNIGASEVTSYDLRYILTDAADKSDDNWTVATGVGTTANPTHSLTDLTFETGYDVQLRAVNEGGAGRWSITTSVTTLADVRGVTLSTTALAVPENGSNTYTVVLASQPTGTVTVTIGGATGTDVSVNDNDADLEFTTSTWNAAQTVTVTAAQDTDAINDEVTLTHTVAGGGYEGVEVADVAVTVQDDERGVTLDKTSLDVEEGGSGTYTIALASQPTGTVTVTIDGATGTDVSVNDNDADLEFTASTWNAAQTVTVTAAQDNDAINDEVTLTHAVAGGGYEGVEVADVAVTVQDDERGVTLDKTSLDVEEGGSGAYTVVLASQPTGTVTVTIGGATGTDVSVNDNDADLEFTALTWNAAQTVTVTAAEDTDAINDEVTLTHTVAGGGYEGVEVADVAVTVQDDERGVTLDKTSLDVEEGGSGAYTVVLASQPTGTVTVTIGGATGTDVSVNDNDPDLEFTASTWNAAQTVTVTAAEDTDAINDEVTLTHAVSGGGYEGVEVADVAVTVQDDERGVTLDKTSLDVEEGGSGAYTVVLASQPTGTVTVTIGGATGTDVSVNDNDADLEFTALTWNAAQTVTVTAAQDNDAINDEVTLTHTVSGGGYDGVEVADVAVTVQDNERGVTLSTTALSVPENGSKTYTVVLASQPTATVTVTIGATGDVSVNDNDPDLEFTTSTWNAAQTVTVTAAEDNDAINDEVTLTHTVTGGGYDGVEVADVTVTVQDDERGVTLSTTALAVPENGSNTYTIALASQPTGTVTVTIGGATGTDVSVNGNDVDLEFTTSTWNAAQTVTVTAAQDNDAINDEVTLTHAVTGGGYDGVEVADVAVTVQDDERGVTLDKTSLDVEEGGSGAYTVVLASQPTGTVTVTIGGATGDVSVNDNDPDLEFTASTWNAAQTVTVTAAQDNDAINDEVTLTHTVAGGGYDGVEVADVAVTVQDNERGVTLSTTALSVPENGSKTYTVVLASQPTATVTVTIGATGDVSVNDNDPDLEFTTSTWNAAQTVTVTAAEDNDAINDEVTLTHTVTGGGYDGVEVADVAVTVQDDERGVTLDKTSLNVEEGGSSTYTVVLASQPTGTVTVTIGGATGTDVSVNGNDADLDFTASTWNAAQTVTVTAAEDTDAINDEVTLTHTVTGGGYEGVEVADVAVTVQDDERGVTLSTTALAVPENGSNTYTIALASQPTGTVTVTIGGATGTDVSVNDNDADLEFTASTWNAAQTVTVTAAQDTDAINDEVTLTHTVAGGGYDGVEVADVAVTVQDDERGVTLDKTSLDVEEGGSGVYTVVLTAQPSSAVTVTIGGAGGDVSVNDNDPDLEFTASTWNAAQTVTVSAAQDNDAINDEVTLTHTVAGGGYDGVEVADVAVTVQDDERGVTLDKTSLDVEEGGSGAYTVVLASQPTGTVTVTIGGATGTDVSVNDNDADLEFTASTWNAAQTVTVTAAEDTDALNDEVTLTHTVAGGGYDGVEVADVAVTVQDDERGVTLDETSLDIEEGGSSTYTVVLASQPTGTVTVTIGGASGDVSVNDNDPDLEFTASTWNTAQTVTVSAAHDADALNDEVTLTHTVAGGGYEGVEVADVAVTVQDDERGVTLDETSLDIEEGGSSTYTVVLASQPTGTVTVTIGGATGTDVSVNDNDADLEFSALTWNAAQTVTVTAAEDNDAINDEVTLTHAVSGGGYEGVEVADVAVTVQDDERGVTLDKTSLDVEEGGSGAYTVVLASQPTGTVTVTIGGATGTDVSVNDNDADLEFTASTWNAAQTVTVTAAEDTDALNDEVTLTHTVAGGGYDGVEVADLTVTVQDDDLTVTVQDDERGVTLDKTSLDIEEGGSGAYTVVLTAQPSSAVTVTIGGASGDVSVNDNDPDLDFTASTWNTAQTVTVSAAHDTDALNDEVTLTHTVAGGGYDGVEVADVAVTVQDDERGVTLDETSLDIEEGGSSTYTVVLASQPTGTVTVTIGGASGTDVSVNDNDADLEFTASTWNAAQTVTVTAAQDTDAINDEVTLTHTVSGGGYDGVEVADVAVTVQDDERGVTLDKTSLDVEEGGSGAYTVVLASQPTGTVTVTIGGATGTDVSVNDNDPDLEFNASTWNAAQTVTVTAAEDADAMNDEVTLTHTVTGGGYDGVEVADVAVTVQDNERGVTLDKTSLDIEEGGSGAYTVVLTAQPSSAVTVTIGGASGDVSVNDNDPDLEFNASTWNTAQTATVSAAHDADAMNDVVTLTHTVAGGGYDGVEVADVMVTVQDDERGVTLDKTSLDIEEGGSGAYTVVLAGQPSGAVTVTIGGASGDVSVNDNDPDLEFNASTWNTAQTVTVSAAHDADAMNDEVTLTHTVSGGGYDGVEVADVAVTVQDDERGVTLDKTSLDIEEGGSGAYTVVLTAQPSSAVTVTIGGASGDVSVNDNDPDLEFTASTWNTAQTVTVSAAHDTDALNDEVTLTHTVAGGGYDGVEVADVAVTVQDDERGVTLDKTSLDIEEGGSGAYTVVLAGQPSGAVTVTIGGASGDVSVNDNDPDLEFNASTWNTAQTVTVSAAHDTDALNDEVTLTHTVSGGGYDGVEVADLTVTIQDDERGVTGLVVSFGARSYEVKEGNSVRIAVLLSADPQRAVVVPLVAEHFGGTTEADYSGVPENVTFSRGGRTRHFLFSATNDSEDDDGEAVVLGFGALPEGLSGTGETTVAIQDDESSDGDDGDDDKDDDSGSGPPLLASFTVDVPCVDDLCTVDTGETVTFSDTSSGVVSQRTWDFGEGSNSGLEQAQHEWSEAGFYTVTLTVTNGENVSTASIAFLVEARDPAGSCEAGPETLCLQDSRYAVEIDWQTRDGNSGAASLAHAGTNDSGVFWFFSRDNWELLIKVLDGCSVNGHMWVYGAATTDVGYSIRVTDTVTGMTREYNSQAGTTAAAITDSTAFPLGCSGPAAAADSSVAAGATESSDAIISDQPSWRLAPRAADAPLGNGCAAGPTSICLQDSRYEVTLSWLSADGMGGSATRARSATADSGVFYFFDPGNWETLVKVLDGCAFNGHHWVLAASATDLGLDLTVRNTATGAMRKYTNEPGKPAPALIDVAAFSESCHQ